MIPNFKLAFDFKVEDSLYFLGSKFDSFELESCFFLLCMHQYFGFHSFFVTDLALLQCGSISEIFNLAFFSTLRYDLIRSDKLKIGIACNMSYYIYMQIFHYDL